MPLSSSSRTARTNASLKTDSTTRQATKQTSVCVLLKSIGFPEAIFTGESQNALRAALALAISEDLPYITPEMQALLAAGKYEEVANLLSSHLIVEVKAQAVGYDDSMKLLSEALASTQLKNAYDYDDDSDFDDDDDDSDFDDDDDDDSDEDLDLDLIDE